MDYFNQNKEYLIELVKDFNPNSANEYRTIYFNLFGKKADNCNCENGKIYNKIKNEINRLKIT